MAERTAVVDRPDTRQERSTPRRRSPLRALTGVLWRVVTDAWIQILAFLRQPRLLLVLVIGPFVVLALFGAGLSDSDPPLAIAFVNPDPEVQEEIEAYAQAREDRFSEVRFTDDADEAVAALRAGDLDMVVEFPPDLASHLEAGEHAPVVLVHDLIDPVEQRAVQLFADSAIDDLNGVLLGRVVAEGQADAGEFEQQISDIRARLALLTGGATGGGATSGATDGDAADEGATSAGTPSSVGGDDVSALREEIGAVSDAAGPSAEMLSSLGHTGPAERLEAIEASLTDLEEAARSGDEAGTRDAAAELDTQLADLSATLETVERIPPDVVVNPLEGQVQALGGDVQLAQFYAPALVAVLLAHLTRVFAGLAVAREGELGTRELYAIAGRGASSRVIGKLLGYLIVGGLLAAVLIAGLVLVLGTPMRGHVGWLAAEVAALIAASTAMGLALGHLARTSGQVVQYAMLFLLAAIFMSGFVLSADRFAPFVRAVAAVLPATHGIELLRGEMLRGSADRLPALLALGLITVAWIALALWRERRSVS